MDLALIAVIGVLAIFFVQKTKEDIGGLLTTVGNAATGKVDQTATTGSATDAISGALLSGHILDPPNGGKVDVYPWSSTFPCTFKLAYNGSSPVTADVVIEVEEISGLNNSFKRSTVVPAVVLPPGNAPVTLTINAELASGLSTGDEIYGVKAFIRLSYAGFPLHSVETGT